MDPLRLIALGESGRAAGYNLLVITLDTVRADHIGCYGNTCARTPNIDRLALHGIRFDHAATTAPITLPSHSSIFTGLYPPQHRVRNNGTYKLAERHETIAEVLSGAGYRTAAFVSAFVLDRRYGLAQGFATYDDQIASRGPARGNRFNERDAKATTDAALVWLNANAHRGQRSSR